MYGWMNNQFNGAYGTPNQYQGGQYMQYNPQMQQTPVLQAEPYTPPNNSAYQNKAQDGRIWVQNETAATAYLMAPNSFVRLWDASKPVFYEKRADESGRPTMDVYEYQKRGNDEAAKEPPVVSVSKDEFEKAVNDFDTRIKEIENLLRG